MTGQAYLPVLLRESLIWSREEGGGELDNKKDGYAPMIKGDIWVCEFMQERTIVRLRVSEKVFSSGKRSGMRDEGSRKLERKWFEGIAQC